MMSVSSPYSPSRLISTPGDSNSSPHGARYPQTAQVLPQPSPLCRWSIHYETSVSYERIDEPQPNIFYDPHDETTWTAWSQTDSTTKFDEALRNGLESNDFSSLNAKGLPLAVSQIVKAAHRSTVEMLVEAFGFSIMSQNADLVHELLQRIIKEEIDVEELHPLHLATSYLDGSRTCCLVLNILCMNMPNPRLYTNSLHYTVLDNLMITILKSHTSCSPSTVNDTWKNEKRFAAEEVDICGRWDADSDCVRALLARGDAAIPFDWKHKFCHTSAQTICHSINTIFYPNNSLNINTPSGLFMKRCPHCGLKMQLTPLHTLVFTGFLLAQQGAKDEDLFGILACATCLLWNGADPVSTSEISFSALSHGDHGDHCNHEELSAPDLAERLFLLFNDRWTVKIQTGWQILSFLLRASQEEQKLGPLKTRGEKDHRDVMQIDGRSDLGDDIQFCDCEGYGPVECTFGSRNSTLGTLHAAFQTEMLTYRRLAEGDSWTSPNLNLSDLLSSVMYEDEPRIGLIEKGLMKPFNRSGIFKDDIKICARAEQVCSSYFMNLEDWSRTKFIEMPQRYYWEGG